MIGPIEALWLQSKHENWKWNSKCFFTSEFIIHGVLLEYLFSQPASPKIPLVCHSHYYMHSLSIYSCTICIFCTFKGKHWVFSFVESVLVDISLCCCKEPPNIYSNEVYSQRILLTFKKKLQMNCGTFWIQKAQKILTISGSI